MFPDSSRFAYEFLAQVSLPDTIYYCDLQLTKDGVGFCQTELKLDNSTNVADLFPQGEKTYNVNGKDVRGWFSIDYIADDLLPNATCKSIFSLVVHTLRKVLLQNEFQVLKPFWFLSLSLAAIQNVLTRPNAFDGQPMLLVEDVTGITKPPPKVWLNVQVSFLLCLFILKLQESNSHNVQIIFYLVFAA